VTTCGGPTSEKGHRRGPRLLNVIRALDHRLDLRLVARGARIASAMLPLAWTRAVVFNLPVRPGSASVDR
jgi:hypothetical protein